MILNTCHHLSQNIEKSRIVGSIPQGNRMQRKCACGRPITANGECAECRKKRLSLQRRAVNEAGPEVAPMIVHEVLRSPGRPLDPTTRSFMESRFNYDFDKVRVHTDATAAESARAVNALAYTVGRDVVFAARQFAPGLDSGKKLLAHELTHVIQQTSSPGAISTCSVIDAVDSLFEREAEAAANRIMSVNTNQPSPGITPLHHSKLVLSKQPDTCPPDRVEEPDHNGTCPEIRRDPGERARFAALGLQQETIFPNECYLLTNIGISRTAIGTPTLLNEIADLLMIDGNLTVHITGFTDCLGGISTNANLRTNRAAAVEDYLINVMGIDASRVIVEWAASSNFLATNSTAEGRARNRGVAIYIERGPTIIPRPDPSTGATVPDTSRLRQLECVIDQGGCAGGPRARPGGTPREEEIRQYNETCKRRTGYNGPDIRPTSDECAQPPAGGFIDALEFAMSLERRYPGWRNVLPDCPCMDAEARNSPEWSGPDACLPGYHPGACSGYRSARAFSSGGNTSHGQQCCYDRNGRLITEGPAAGTPDLWAPIGVINTTRHYFDDVRPFDALGWEIYNRYWIPNNDNNCPANRGGGRCEERENE